MFRPLLSPACYQNPTVGIITRNNDDKICFQRTISFCAEGPLFGAKALLNSQVR